MPARHQQAGEVVGSCEVVVPADGTGGGLHSGTTVLPAHRSDGLASWLTANVAVLVAGSHPGLGGLVSDSAAENAPMRRAGAALGYVDTRVEVQLQRGL